MAVTSSIEEAHSHFSGDPDSTSAGGSLHPSGPTAFIRAAGGADCGGWVVQASRTDKGAYERVHPSRVNML